ncbi:MAG: IPT/TIG domain-containing protein, partial [Cyanobacteria bacterium NC_groundwater_1444_Ag_S-0.65um_54_12]|nr:IPT/TIG domain-containing protein [Cyanobacteria bacterium NC_groundwater_1444_Ag_S-0.65um_54_12]
PSKGIVGRVLDLSGQPAVRVPVQGYLISNNASGIISNNANGLISNNSNGLVQGAAYRTQAASAALATRTDDQGYFLLETTEGQLLNLEAVLSDEVKALLQNVTKSAQTVEMQLAYTGRIRGRVLVESAGGTADLLGVDVFIPATGYLAKTDSAGNYEIPYVPPGRFTLAAIHPDFGRGFAYEVVVRSKQTAAAPDILLSASAPRLTALVPPSGPPGQTITISGSNFAVTQGKKPEVYFNGSNALVVESSDTMLKALVPVGAISGQLNVKVNGLRSNSLPFAVWRTIAVEPEYWSSEAVGTIFNYNQEAAGYSVGQPLAEDMLSQGLVRRYVARVLDTADQPVSDPVVSWTVDRTDRASIDQAGLLQAQQTGRVSIKAQVGELLAGMAVEIVAPISQLTIFPATVPDLNPPLEDQLASASLPPYDRDSTGAAASLSVLAQFADGSSHVLPALWSVNDPTWVTLDPLGPMRCAVCRSLVATEMLLGARAGAPDSVVLVTARVIADLAKSAAVPIRLRRQGSLAVAIE